MAVLRILAVVDGRAGHEKQIFGIIAALRRYQPVSVITIPVDHSLLVKLKILLQFLFPFLAPLKKEEKKADLILCAGRKTHFPAILRKRQYGTPLCTCMTPGMGFRWLFDLCFVPEHDLIADAPNIIQTLGAPNLCVDYGRHDEQFALLLVGGEDPRSHRWPEEKLLEEISMLLEGSEEKTWIISSSPRTPESTVEKLQHLALSLPKVNFYNYHQTPRGWLEEQYEKAAEAWITSDSISMVYEALSAGCRVGLLSVDWQNDRSKFARNEHLLLSRSVVLSFSDWRQGKKGVQPGKFNEAQRCADAIMEKWWPENLQ